MSHKTGKRVLTASTSLALALVGLAATPFAAHAAAGDLTVQSACGTTDQLVVKKDTGTYTVYNASGQQIGTINSATQQLTTSMGGTPQTLTGVIGPNGSSYDATIQTQWGPVVWAGTAGTAGRDAAKHTFANATVPTTAPANVRAAVGYYRSAAQPSEMILTIGSTDTAAAIPNSNGTLVKSSDGTILTIAGLYVGASGQTAGSATGDAVATIKLVRDGSGNRSYQLIDASANVMATVTSAGVVTTAGKALYGAATSASPTTLVEKNASYSAGESAGYYTAPATPATAPSVTVSTVGTSTSTSMTPTDTTNTYYSVRTPAAWYDATQPNSPIRSGYYVTDAQGTRIDGLFTGIDGVVCATDASIPVPSVDVANRTITVKKGLGFKWTVAKTAGTAAVNARDAAGDHTVTSPYTIDFGANAGPDATATVTASSTGTAPTVQLIASPADGYTGGTRTFNVLLDGATNQLIWTNPVVNDRDGKESDTVTLTNYTGVTYYYKVVGTGLGASTASDAHLKGLPAAGGRTADDSNDVNKAGNGWTQVPSGTGSTLSITRPATMSNTDEMAIVAFAGSGKAWSTTATDIKQTFVAKFTDTIWVRSIPAPTLVDGVGSADYYILPAVPGITWTVKNGKGDTVATYNSNDSRLGQQMPVFTANPPEKFTFTASKDTSDSTKSYEIAPSVIQREWTKVFDNRAQVTPAAPEFIDKTGFVDDAVRFPELQAGLNGYKFAVTSPTATEPLDAGGSADYKFADFTWSQKDKTVPLADLQRAFLGSVDPSKTKVWIKVEANNTTYTLATDASGNPVTNKWSYNFTNALNIVAAAPTQAAVAGDPTKYTLTFPVDEKVIYSVVDSNGVTRDVAYGDMGKPLTYSGTTMVRARAASSIYVIQPKTDGTAPAPWTFMPVSKIVTPQAPTGHDMDGLDGDNYSLPKQDGIIWNVNGVDVDPAKYGTDLKTGGALKLVIVAQAASGYTLKDGAQSRWELTFTPGKSTPSAPTVNHENVEDADVPTAKVTWSADGAAGYKVTYQKLLGNGERAQELTWYKNTTATSANFVAMPGDQYYIRVAAIGSDGTMSEVKETLVKFVDPGNYYSDITTGVGTYGGSWDQLTNLMSKNLPYIKGTAALGYNGSSWTVTLPAGTTKFDLFATVHQYGAAGKIQVNGQNWADFTTNSNVWKQVTDPYAYPVRTIQGWDSSKPVTIKVMITGTREQYVALDAYKAHN